MPVFIVALVMVHTIVQIILGAAFGLMTQALVAIVALPVVFAVCGALAWVSVEALYKVGVLR